MELTVWLSVATICVLGAMSPGPSLAVVVRNTVHGSAAQGFLKRNCPARNGKNGTAVKVFWSDSARFERPGQERAEKSAGD